MKNNKQSLRVIFFALSKYIGALVIILFILSSKTFAQGTQNIRGKIVDDASKTPLPGVTILVLDSTKNIATSTDIEGDYKISNVPLGRQTLKISFIGYEPVLLQNVMVTAGKEVILNINMTESINNLNEVIVSYDRTKDKTVTNNEMTTVSSRSFNIEDTKKYAGTLGDPSRMAANFAGVIAGNDSRNDIVVRGNSPTGMLWQLEGLNIPNPNHFGAFGGTGGPVSMLNNNNLDKSDFMTSAFPAQYGNATAGAFDLKLKDGNNEKHELMTQMGFNGAEIGAEGPFSKKSKASYIINYRYSTLSIFKELGLNVGTGNAVPEYQDLNFKMSFPLKNNNSKITLFGLGGISNADILGNDVDTTQTDFYGQIDQNQYAKYKTGIIGSSYERNIGEKTHIKFTLGASASDQRFSSDSIAIYLPEKPVFKEQTANFNNQKYSAIININHKFNSKNTLNAGANTDLMKFDFLNERNFNGVNRQLVNQKGEAYLSQGYAQLKHRFTNKFSLNIGAHAQHFSYTNDFVVEPRAGLKYALNGRSSFNLGYGIHHQMQSIYNYFVETPTENGIELTNKDMGFTKSEHYVLGFDMNITEFVRIKIEAYYQQLSKVPVNTYSSSYSSLNDGLSFAPSDVTNLVNKGTGTNYGAELTLERYLNKGFYFLITGSLFDSKYKGSDGVERNTAFNTKYAANILAGKEFNLGKIGSTLALNIKSTLIGGRYLTPLDLELSRLSGTSVYDYRFAYSARQKEYFRTDFKITYKKDYKKSTLETGIDIQNITNTKNIFQQGYNAVNNTIATQYQTGLLPIPFVRFTF
ncbi:MAG TPA: TonB-dependent receptor [Bacteroidia bacterium]|nr:TonB-dependent receptor [Bacteroidia bacterium]